MHIPLSSVDHDSFTLELKLTSMKRSHGCFLDVLCEMNVFNLSGRLQYAEWTVHFRTHCSTGGIVKQMR